MDKPRVHAPFSVLTIIEEEPTQTVSNPVSVSALAISHSSRIITDEKRVYGDLNQPLPIIARWMSISPVTRLKKSKQFS